MKYYVDFKNINTLTPITDNRRVLHIKQSLSVDGATIIELRLARALEGRIIMDWLVLGDEAENDDEFIRLGSNIYYVKQSFNNTNGNLEKVKFYYRFFKQTNYRAIYCDTESPARAKMLFVAKIAEVPIRVIHSHNSLCQDGIGKINYHFSRLMMPFVLTEGIACSQLAAEWMFPKCLQPKVKIIRNGLEPSKWKYNSNTRDKMRSELRMSDSFVVGHVGRFCFQKNHDKLIDIFSEIKKQRNDAVLMLVGEGELEDAIKKKVKANGLENSVLFLGKRTDTYRLYQAMDVFVLPSRYEGLPLVGVEAQAAGLPCVMSDKVTAETKILNSTVFVPLDASTQQWSDAIIETQKNFVRKDTTEEMRKAGFDIEEEAKVMTIMYNSMIINGGDNMI